MATETRHATETFVNTKVVKRSGAWQPMQKIEFVADLKENASEPGTLLIDEEINLGPLGILVETFGTANLYFSIDKPDGNGGWLHTLRGDTGFPATPDPDPEGYEVDISYYPAPVARPKLAGGDPTLPPRDTIRRGGDSGVDWWTGAGAPGWMPMNPDPSHRVTRMRLRVARSATAYTPEEQATFNALGYRVRIGLHVPNMTMWEYEAPIDPAGSYVLNQPVNLADYGLISDSARFVFLAEFKRNGKTIKNFLKREYTPGELLEPPTNPVTISTQGIFPGGDYRNDTNNSSNGRWWGGGSGKYGINGSAGKRPTEGPDLLPAFETGTWLQSSVGDCGENAKQLVQVVAFLNGARATEYYDGTLATADLDLATIPVEQGGDPAMQGVLVAQSGYPMPIQVVFTPGASLSVERTYAPEAEDSGSDVGTGLKITFVSGVTTLGDIFTAIDAVYAEHNGFVKTGTLTTPAYVLTQTVEFQISAQVTPTPTPYPAGAENGCTLHMRLLVATPNHQHIYPFNQTWNFGVPAVQLDQDYGGQFEYPGLHYGKLGLQFDAQKIVLTGNGERASVFGAGGSTQLEVRKQRDGDVTPGYYSAHTADIEFYANDPTGSPVNFGAVGGGYLSDAEPMIYLEGSDAVRIRSQNSQPVIVEASTSMDLFAGSQYPLNIAGHSRGATTPTEVGAALQTRFNGIQADGAEYDFARLVAILRSQSVDATGWVNFGDGATVHVLAGDEIAVAGNVFVASAAPAGPLEFAVGADDTATADNFMDVFNSYFGGALVASVDPGTSYRINIVAPTSGPNGNLNTLAGDLSYTVSPDGLQTGSLTGGASYGGAIGFDARADGGHDPVVRFEKTDLQESQIALMQGGDWLAAPNAVFKINGDGNLTIDTTQAGQKDIITYCDDMYFHVGYDFELWADNALNLECGVADSTETMRLKAPEFGRISFQTWIEDTHVEIVGISREGLDLSNAVHTTLPAHQEGRVFYDITAHALAYYDDVATSLIRVTANHKTGMGPRSEATLSWDNPFREFAPNPTNGSFTFWVDDQKFVVSGSPTIVIPDTVGQHFVYFDATGTLVSSTSAWDPASTQTVPVATIYWDGTNGAIGEERHSAERDLALHAYLHHTRGTAYDSGLAGTFTNTTLSIATGTVFDEDLRLDLTGPLTSCKLWYRNGSNQMVFSEGSTTPYAVNAGALQWDNAGTLTNAGANKYVANWVYATNDLTHPVYVVVGQTEHTTITLARAGTDPVLPNIGIREWKLLYKVIYQNVGGTPTFVESSDYRTVSPLPGGNVTSIPASAVVFTPAAQIESTNVQAALEEVAVVPPFTSGTLPAASSAWVQHFVYVRDAAGDGVLKFCRQKADDSYEWVTVNVTP